METLLSLIRLTDSRRECTSAGLRKARRDHRAWESGKALRKDARSPSHDFMLDVAAVLPGLLQKKRLERERKAAKDKPE
jgi:hypothetical protein